MRGDISGIRHIRRVLWAGMDAASRREQRRRIRQTRAVAWRRHGITALRGHAARGLRASRLKYLSNAAIARACAVAACAQPLAPHRARLALASRHLPAWRHIGFSRRNIAVPPYCASSRHGGRDKMTRLNAPLLAHSRSSEKHGGRQLIASAGEVSMSASVWRVLGWFCSSKRQPAKIVAMASRKSISVWASKISAKQATLRGKLVAGRRRALAAAVTA